jgi:hypothetical protein
MAINWRWPGLVWLENTSEDALKVFAYTMAGAMMAAQVKDMGGVNWAEAFSQAGFCTLAAVFGAVASLKIGPGRSNGTASFLPRVVAKDEPAK